MQSIWQFGMFDGDSAMLTIKPGYVPSLEATLINPHTKRPYAATKVERQARHEGFIKSIVDYINAMRVKRGLKPDYV